MNEYDEPWEDGPLPLLAWAAFAVHVLAWVLLIWLT